MVTKSVLNQYADLQKELVEVRERIEKLERQINRVEEEGAVVDKVRGGDGGLQSFRIEGFPYPEYSRKKSQLISSRLRQKQLETEISEKIDSVESFICGIDDSFTRRIVTLRIIDGLSWNQVADRMGGKNTEDSVRKAFERLNFQK